MDQEPDQSIDVLRMELAAGENIPQWLYRRRCEKRAQRHAERQAQRNLARAAQARGRDTAVTPFGPSTVVILDSYRRRRR